MRAILSAAMLAASVSAAAASQWAFDAATSDFGSAGIYTAVTASGEYGLGLRCQGGVTVLVLITPERTSQDVVDTASLLQNTVLLRPDRGNIIEISVDPSLSKGRLIFTGAIPDGDINSIAAAKTSISAAVRMSVPSLQAEAQIIHEHRFSASGARSTINRLVTECAGEQS